MQFYAKSMAVMPLTTSSSQSEDSLLYLIVIGKIK